MFNFFKKPIGKFFVAILGAVVAVAGFLFFQNTARAAITVAQVGAVGSTSQVTTQTVTSFTPATNTLYLLWAIQTFGSTPATPTVACANGLSMVQVNTVTFGTIATPTRRITLFRAMKASGLSTGTCTITWNQTSTGGGYSLMSFAGVDTSGTDGSRAIVQSTIGATDSATAATGLSISLSALQSGSTTAGGFSNALNTTNSLTPGAGYTAGTSFNFNTPATSARAEWNTTGSATVNMTQSATSHIGGIAVEVRSADVTAPTPNPMTFATVPTNDSATQISMTSTTSTDTTPPVNYLFTNNNTNCGASAGTGGVGGAWQTSTVYSNSGLQANKCYGYTVTARDSVTPTPNTGTASSISSTYTSANIPGIPTLSGATATTLNLTNAENSNPASSPTTNFAVQVVTTSPSDANWLNKWVDASGNPVAVAVWMTDAQLDALILHSLQPSTLYGVKVKARNQDTDETALSAEGQGMTSSAPVTTLSNFVTAEPSNATIAPGASTQVDSFGLQTSVGTDTVTGATVTLAAGTGARVATVVITNNGDTVTYCSATPSGDTAALTSCGIPASTTNTQFKIKITAIAHAAMPAPPGGSYAVTGRVTAFTSTNAQITSDTGSATITIDNLSPANATSISGGAGNAQVTLNWTNPADADYISQVVLRRSGTAVADTPVEGSTYTVSDTIGTATVVCVVATPTTACTDTGLTNGTAYHYKTFSKDSRGNYSTGVAPTGSPFTPSLSTFTITSSAGAHGTISPLGITPVAQNSDQAYTITPSLGYDVATLVVDGSSVATSTSYTFGSVQTNHTIAVTFVLITPTYTITSSAGANGTISPLGATVFLQGTSQTYTITPTSGYYVDVLTVDGSSVATSTSYTFTNIQADHTISATFALIPPPPGTFAITASAGANGAINPDGVTIVTQGNSQTYTITPNTGYDIATLTVDSTPVATSTTYTFTNVQVDHTINTTFVALPVGVSATPPDTGASRATTIIFSGKAFPSGIISVIDKQLNTEKILGQKVVADEDGSFNISFVGILQALHSFGVIAKDNAGRISQSKFFFINTISDDLVVKDLLLPPTTELINNQVTRGKNAVLTGSATPGYTVRLELDGKLGQSAIVDTDGTYKFEISTGALDFGTHRVRIRQSNLLNKKESDFSISRTLTVSRLLVVQADLNGDGKIDIRDWSIFLSLWASKNAIGRERVDFNQDGKVDITDFSIFIKTVRKK